MIIDLGELAGSKIKIVGISINHALPKENSTRATYEFWCRKYASRFVGISLSDSASGDLPDIYLPVSFCEKTISTT